MKYITVLYQSTRHNEFIEAEQSIHQDKEFIMFIKKVALSVIAIGLIVTTTHASADGFSTTQQRIETQLKREGYTPNQVNNLLNANTPEINALRTYLKSSCLSYSNSSGSSGYGDIYIGSNTHDYLTLDAKGTFSSISNSAAYSGGGVNAMSQGGNTMTGYWNVFQGSNGSMILVMSPASGGVSLSTVISYDSGAISTIPQGENTVTTWRKKANSRC